MGYIAHHAIIVTSWNSELIGKAHVEASRIFPVVSPILPSGINGYRSFFIPPDGSKENWAESNLGDKRRNHYLRMVNEFRAFVRQQEYSDGSTALDCVEVRYGGDEPRLASAKQI